MRASKHNQDVTRAAAVLCKLPNDAVSVSRDKMIIVLTRILEAQLRQPTCRPWIVSQRAQCQSMGHLDTTERGSIAALHPEKGVAALQHFTLFRETREVTVAVNRMDWPNQSVTLCRRQVDLGTCRPWQNRQKGKCISLDR